MLEALILGLIQGLTEFIPVSSSGHLVIVQQFLSGASSHQFLEWINIGTILALVVYFRRRIVQIFRDILEHKKYTLARNILITSIPAGIVGFFLSGFINSASFFGSLTVVTIALGLVGIIMILLEKFPKASKRKDGTHLSAWRALVIGIAQMCALIPGVSRSGSTIITGRLVGLDSKAAAEYSFLASLPIMCGVTVKIFISSSDRMYLFDNFTMVILSNIVAFVAGLFSVGFLMNYLSRHTLVVFGWYRVALAAVIGVVLLVQ